jgi:16S rRNA (guanine1207-N2)-methyltransferase
MLTNMISAAEFVPELPALMELPSQIISKNLDGCSVVGKGLWINPGQDSAWHEAATYCQQLTLFCQDRGAFVFHQNPGVDVHFGAFPDADNAPYDWIIISLPRQKALLQMLLECAAAMLADDGTLWLAGENKAGIKSSGKWLKEYFSSVKKIDNARHCTLYEAAKPLKHREFSSSLYRNVWELDEPGCQLQIVSYPGVFAHGRLDPGTRLLLQSLPDLPIGNQVLDFGCGAGVIGACIKRLYSSAQVSFLDTNALALKSCEETLAANELHGTVLASSGLDELSGQFDWVVSNPPIHNGLKTDNRLSMQLLEPLLQHLRPGAQFLLVANRHLPYENWLSERFTNVKEFKTNDNFKVLLASN